MAPGCSSLFDGPLVCGQPAGFDCGEIGCHFNPALQNAIMANRQMPTIPIVTPIILLSLFSVRNKAG